MRVTTRWVVSSDVSCFAILFCAFLWKSMHVHSLHAMSLVLLTTMAHKQCHWDRSHMTKTFIFLHFILLYLAFFLSSLSASPQLLKHHTALTLSQAKAHLCLCARGCFTDTWALSSDVKWERGLSLSATRLVAPLAPLITSSISSQRLVWSLLKCKQPLKYVKGRGKKKPKN